MYYLKAYISGKRIGKIGKLEGKDNDNPTNNHKRRTRRDNRKT